MSVAPRRDERTAIERTISLSRRQFLRGAGACVALPLFASHGASRLLAADAAPGAKLAATASGTPLRTAFVYFPNGAIPGVWWPKGEGKDFAFSRTLQPLEKSKPHIQILGGLNQRPAEAGPDGGGDHAR